MLHIAAALVLLESFVYHVATRHPCSAVSLTPILCVLHLSFAFIPRSPFAKTLRDDLRSSRSMLEAALAEEAKQNVEMQLNPNVLAMCVEQAKRLKDSAVSMADQELQVLVESMAAQRTRFAAACTEETSTVTSDLQLELANLRAGEAELIERMKARSEDERKALEQKKRLADEFGTLKETVEKFRESESEHAASLAAEVRALESEASARLANENQAMASEIASIRAMCAAEAEVGKSGLLRVAFLSRCAAVLLFVALTVWVLLGDVHSTSSTAVIDGR